MIEDNGKKIVFLCSAGGGNLAFILHAIERGLLKARVTAVLTDRGCPANLIANRAGIFTRCINFNEVGQICLYEELVKLNPDIIITNVHKILQDTVVDAFQGKLVNVHYSLLPAFGGLIGVKQIKAPIRYGAKFTGVTVHLVDKSVDGGLPLIQAVIPLRRKEKQFGELMTIVFRCGCISLLGAFDYLFGHSIPIEGVIQLDIMGRQCLINGLASLPDSIDESFWQNVLHKATEKS